MPLNPNQKEAARDLIRRYCERAEDNRGDIHYSQARPMTHLGDSPSSEFTADCSGYATSAFYWADKHTKYKINDPNGLKYSGWGFTGTLLSHNRNGRVPLDRKFYVGDMCIYGSSFSNTVHVVICRKNGDRKESVWSSHGSELGPYPVYMDYRPDILIVVRTLDLR
jgi:hypothetical protein